MLVLGKLTSSMAMFNSDVTNDQRVWICQVIFAVLNTDMLLRTLDFVARSCVGDVMCMMCVLDR